MATTTGGSTYVTSTDLVANYPTASLALANRVDVVASGSMSKKTASYTVTVADILAGTAIAMNSASATVITLPSTSLVNGMRLNVFSVNTGAVTFTGGTVTGTVNSISAQYSGVSLTYDSAAAVWWCLPFSSGVSAANFTNTATGTYTGYKYLTMTGNTSLVIDRAGFADIVVAGGGGGAGQYFGGGGGGGGVLEVTNAYFAVGTYSVIVGGGGSAGVSSTHGQNGTSSQISNYYGIGGGGGGGQLGNVGGSAGGNQGGLTTVVQGIPGQGYGNGGYEFAAGGAGGAATAHTTPGIGRTVTITGSSTTYGPGGGSGSGSAGANTGKGGERDGGVSTGNGGSGIVIIRVAV